MTPQDPGRYATKCVTCGGKDQKKKYKTAKEAAVAQVQKYNPQSIAENREYGGWIDQNPDGTFSPGDTYRGGTDGINVPGQDGDAVANWHTHGAFDPAYQNEIFSPGDINHDYWSQTTGYLGTPNGDIKVNVPAPGGDGMPQDPGQFETLPETAK